MDGIFFIFGNILLVLGIFEENWFKIIGGFLIFLTVHRIEIINYEGKED